jgi:hypothetical protein
MSIMPGQSAHSLVSRMHGEAVGQRWDVADHA